MKNIIFVCLLVQTCVFSQAYILKINDKVILENQTDYKKSFEVFGVDTTLKNIIEKELLTQEAKKMKLNASESFGHKIQKYKNENLDKALAVDEKKAEMLSEIKSRIDKDLGISILSIKIKMPYQKKDTLEAFSKLQQIKFLFDQTKDIGQLVDKIKSSEVTVENRVISHMDLPYIIQKKAFAIKKEKESSDIFILDGKANLIVLDEILYKKGRYELKQILILDSLHINKIKIDEAYKELTIDKKPFETVLSKYVSDLKFRNLLINSSKINSSDFPLDIQMALEKIKPNEYTPPIKSVSGWHIFQLISFAPIDDFDKLTAEEFEKKLHPELLQSELNDQIIKNAKKHFVLTTNEKHLYQFKSIAFDSFQSKKNIAINKLSHEDKFIFAVNKNEITSISEISSEWNKKITALPIGESFELYFSLFQEEMKKLAYLNYAINHVFEYNKVMAIEYEKYVNELLYQEMIKKLATQSIHDKPVQRKYYKENKNNFIQDKRGKGFVYICQDEEMANKVLATINNEIELTQLIKTYSGKPSPKNTLYLNTYYGEFDMNNKYMPMNAKLETGIQKIKQNNKVHILNFKKILPKSIIPFKKAIPIIIQEYGSYYIENKANELGKKAKIKYNNLAIRELKQKYIP